MKTTAQINQRIFEQARSLPEGYVEHELRTAIQDALALYGSEGVRQLASDMIDDFSERLVRQ